MINQLLTKNPNISINELVRSIWKIDIDINVNTIIRNYFRYKRKNIKPLPNKIKLPSNIDPISKFNIRDMEKYGVELSFKSLRRYGVSVEDIKKIEKANGWNGNR